MMRSRVLFEDVSSPEVSHGVFRFMSRPVADRLLRVSLFLPKFALRTFRFWANSEVKSGGAFSRTLRPFWVGVLDVGGVGGADTDVGGVNGRSMRRLVHSALSKEKRFAFFWMRVDSF